MVDDDVTVRMLIGIALEAQQVIEASRVQEALDIVATEAVDAAVIDHRIPDGDGLIVVRALRRSELNADIPVVVLTAGYEPERLPIALGAGADAYVGKPFEPADLETLLVRLLAATPQQRRTRRTLLRARALVGKPPGPFDELLDELVEPPAPPARGRFGRGRARRPP